MPSLPFGLREPFPAAPNRHIVSTGALLGIITALPAEARSAGARAAPVGEVVRIRDGVLLIRCGMGRARAARAAEALARAGAGALLSWGTAAALDPSLPPGEVLLPATVLSRDGQCFEVDAPWRGALASLFADAGSGHGGGVAEAEHVLADAGEKRRLRDLSGARIADMESAAIAEVCRDAALRLLVVRAVSDRASMRVPACALAGVNADGDLALGPCLRGLALAPGDLAALLRLARGFRRACARLSALAKQAGPCFQLPAQVRAHPGGPQA